MSITRPRSTVSWLRPNAYMTDGKRLARIVQVGNDKVAFEDCRTLVRFVFKRPYVLDKFRLVKPAGKEQDDV